MIGFAIGVNICYNDPLKSRMYPHREEDGQTMKFIKRIRNGLFGFSVLIIALGIFLMVEPHFSATIICYIFGAIIIACGVIDLLNYFLNAKQRDYLKFDMVKGIALLALGLFVVIKPDFFSAILPTVFGLVILVDGIAKILSAFELNDGGKVWISIMVLGVVTSILGIIIVINPFTIVNISMVIIGISLVCDGLSSMWCQVNLKKRMKSRGDYVDTDNKDIK